MDDLKFNQLMMQMKQRKLSKKDKSFIMNELDEPYLSLFINSYKVKKTVSKTKRRHHRSLNKSIITVFDQPDLAAELACSMGKFYDDKIAIVDFDRLTPVLDIYLNEKYISTGIYSHMKLDKCSGLNLMIDVDKKNVLSANIIKRIGNPLKNYKNVVYFSGNYIINDYEYVDLNIIKRVIGILKHSYDCVILSTNGFIYDGTTCIALMTSDMNILPLNGHIADFRKKKKLIEYVSDKQNILKSKNFYLLYNHLKDNHLEEKTIKHLTDGYYLGNIPFNKLRNGSFQFGYPMIKRKNLKHSHRKVIEKINERLFHEHCNHSS